MTEGQFRGARRPIARRLSALAGFVVLLGLAPANAADVSDSFGGSGLGAWAEDTANWTETGGVARVDVAGASLIRYNTDLSGPDQWACTQLSDFDDLPHSASIGVALRASNSGSQPFYSVVASGNSEKLAWRYHANSSDPGTMIEFLVSGYNPAEGDYLCARVNGDGVNTDVKGWLFNAPPADYNGDSGWNGTSQGSVQFSIGCGATCKDSGASVVHIGLFQRSADAAGASLDDFKGGAYTAVAECSDGVDNDGDGLTDHPNDPGCSSPSDPSEVGSAACDDGIDNDGDGLVDASNDPGCTGPGDASELGSTACDDGVDNDGDLGVDSADPGCTGPSDNNERGGGQCDDGIDNDGDGKTDFPADPDCTWGSDNREAEGAHGTDYHVLKDLDGDGNADPCPNAAHRGTYSSDSVSCGSTFDIDGDGTPERLYCDIQAAANQAVNAGDTVEIHQADYGPNDSSFASVQFVCDYSVATVRDEVMLVVKPCPTCTSEDDRRHFRAAEMNGSADTSVNLNPAGCTNCTSTIAIGQSGTQNIPYVTIKGLYIQDTVFAGTCDSYTNGRYGGAITLAANADHLVIDDVDGNLASWNSTSECAFGNGAGIQFMAQPGAGSDDISDVTVRNVDFESCHTIGVKCGSCSIADNGFKRWRIHDNRFVTWNDTPGSIDSESLYEFKGFDSMAFYNNTIDCKVGDQWGKYRYSDGSMIWFNNVFSGCRSFIFHQGGGNPASHNGSDVDWYVFNNTVRVTSGKAQIFHPENVSGNGGDGDDVKRLVNNSWAATTSGLAVCAYGRTEVMGYEHFEQSSYGTSPTVTDFGSYVCDDDDPCGTQTGIGDCNGGSTCDAHVPGPDTAFPHKLSAGSTLIDAGTNDPLGQGPDTCRVSAADGLVNFPGGLIDCTLDREGDERIGAGGTWDIGADEHDADVSPPVCGDGAREGAEECDGADFGGLTCVDYGFTGGTLACTGGCTVDTSGCVNNTPGDVTNARRTDVR
jgi:hypothetical protein